MTEGEYDPATGKTTEVGSMPVDAKGKMAVHRMVSWMEGNDRLVMEMYAQGDDGEFHQNMELIYTRKNAAK